MPQAQLEKKMDEYLVKKAPFQIPENGRKAIVEWMPWISLIFGILALLASLGLWHAGHAADALVDYSNSLSTAYGTGTVISHLGLVYYVALISLVLQGALMVIAFPGLKSKSKKKGWDILLFSAVVSFVYGIFVSFSSFGAFANFAGSLVGVLAGLYILAQIKSHYK